MNTKAKIVYAIVYLLLLVPSLAQMGMLWLWFAPDRLYHCSDDVGPVSPWELMQNIRENPLAVFPMLFYLPFWLVWPAFLHIEATSPSGVGSEYLIWPEPMVAVTWLAFIAVGLLIPVLVIWLFRRGVRYARGSKGTK